VFKAAEAVSILWVSYCIPVVQLLHHVIVLKVYTDMNRFKHWNPWYQTTRPDSAKTYTPYYLRQKPHILLYRYFFDHIALRQKLP
jgi:hypothetical protein